MLASSNASADLRKCRCCLTHATTHSGVASQAGSLDLSGADSPLREQQPMELKLATTKDSPNILNDLANVMPVRSDMAPESWNQTPSCHDIQVAEKSRRHQEEVLQQTLIFTCPFLLSGCRFMALRVNDWSEHIAEH